MTSVGDAIQAMMFGIGTVEHIPAKDGDFIGDDELMHCGKCRQVKEHRFQDGRYTKCACKCAFDEYAAELAEKQREAEMDRVKELNGYSLTDERFNESTFDRFKAETPEDARVLRICRNYAAHFDEMLASNTGLIFYGSPGTGKTFAASCIANALMAQRVPVLVTSIVRLTANAFGEDLNELLWRMNTARLLVLDDFGAERNTEFKAEQIFTVIDARYAAKKPMIITSNLTDFKTETDMRRKRVYDRIFEVCAPIRMDGESKRRAEGQKKRDTMRAILEM